MLSRVTSDPILDTIVSEFQDGRAVARQQRAEGSWSTNDDAHLDELVGLNRARTAVEDLVAEYVAHARHAGSSWSEIGEALGGLSKQAAQQRYGRS